MNTQQAELENASKKLDEILLLYQQSQNQVLTLSQGVEELITLNQMLETKVEDLEKNIISLQNMNESLVSAKDNSELKIQLETFINEIDECLLKLREVE